MLDDYNNGIEFFRDAFVLVPVKEDERYETVLIPDTGKKKNRIFCSCSNGREPNCSHAKLLVKHYVSYIEGRGAQKKAGRFDDCQYRRFLLSIGRVSPEPVARLTIEFPRKPSGPLTIFSGKMKIATYHTNGDERERLVSRLEPSKAYSRAWLIDKVSCFVESEYERAMRVSGHKTVKMVEESSFWYRFAYHCFMEFGDEDITWDLEVDAKNGTVLLHGNRSNKKVFTMYVPTQAVSGVVDTFKKEAIGSPRGDSLEPEAELLFRIYRESPGQITILPVTIENGRVFSVCPEYCYGSFCYRPENGTFIRFTQDSLKRVSMGWNRKKIVTDDAFAFFVKDNQSTLSIGSNNQKTCVSIQTDLFGEGVYNDLRRIIDPPVVVSFDRIELRPKSVRGSQWTIEIFYRAGNTVIKLPPLLQSQEKKEPYCLTDNCIVDMGCREVTDALAQARSIGSSGVLSLSSMSLMLLRGSTISLQFEGDEKLTKKIKKMFTGKPRKEVILPEDFMGTLRTYQRNGVSWLAFLYDYYLGGLLCDEMGLGKTIQTIALITMIMSQRNSLSAYIVCPTSVIGHWRALFARFSPSVRVLDYAKDRKLPIKANYDVVLISYGIMRNDIDLLERKNIDLLVYDEIQQLKNPDTAAYRAACRLRGRTIIGLTGTPVENCADDLKSLFNIVLPGLSIDIPSETALLKAVNGNADTSEITRFRRRIEPFILRRVKVDVAKELPEKTEEKRFCQLSPYQAELYRETLVNKGVPLVADLTNEDKPVPYLHIFALMTHLKQLCNTPALLSGKWKEYNLYESGKWELFKELLDESLGSGQKIVVFTQFVGMVEIFRHYLESINIGYEVLTGKSIHRDKIIKRFAENNACRVFIGSLKAGGVGIDLIAASVVIHYDRWWNAAREEQATDRVHRIGQTKGVQVFKLVTENTLEERIDQIIERKKELSYRTLPEDDPESVKLFTRKELIALLSIPDESNEQS